MRKSSVSSPSSTWEKLKWGTVERKYLVMLRNFALRAGIKQYGKGDDEASQWLKAVAVLPDNLSLTPGTT